MRLRGLVYAFAASFMFGLGAVLAKFLSGVFATSIIAIVALSVSGLLLAGVAALTRAPFLTALRGLGWREWLDLLLLACPGTAIPLLVIVAGFSQTSALEGGLLLQLNGVAALLFAVILLGERIRWKQGLGVLLLLLGGTLVVVAGASGGSGGSNLGNLLILVGSVGVGFGYIPAKRLVARIDPLSLSAWRLLFGAATIAPVTTFQLLTAARGLLWQPALANLAILGLYTVTNFALAYVAQQGGLRLLEAWQVAAIGQTVPLFSTFFAILLLHESLTLLQGAGGLLAIAGGIVVSLNNTAQKPLPVAAVAAPEALEAQQASCAD